jgi:hypothetical protein
MAKLSYKSFGVTNKIDITNWIALKEKGADLQVFVGTHVYLVPRTSIDDFHIACDSWKITTKKFKYLHSSLTCEKCWGKTRFDWIERTVGINENIRDPSMVESCFKRNPKGMITIYRAVNLSYEGIYHLSSPKIIDGYELCSNCRGTGLRMFKEVMPEYKEYKPKGGISWKELVIDVPDQPHIR